MTRERTKELMPVLQAWAEGKEIQVIGRSPNWETYRPNDPGACPDFSNKQWVWRVKLEPREFWVVINGANYPNPAHGWTYMSRAGAEEIHPGVTPIRVREVL